MTNRDVSELIHFLEHHATANSRQVNMRLIFNLLLTVHHAMILGNCPTWRTNSFQYSYL